MIIRLHSRTLGMLVRQLRRCHRVPPHVLATYLHISESQLNLCERGLRAWRKEDLQALDRYFGSTALMDAARAAFEGGYGPEAA